MLYQPFFRSLQNGILKGFSAKIFKISENPYFFCLSFQTFNELFAELKVYGNELITASFIFRFLKLVGSALKGSWL
ncbi:hypothetical protein IX84_13000 [Phaeodactylibacter xiamenensis]|uniref:Uncharacterized protein n=2 Tax=Phaeodactylibacter xiamenensis TaxID=1524460 RepID=A0A098S6K1_9BACT|nr:hypothetical protein IX84_13000 [Phaeodactylibacter xiamenensis]